MREGIGACRCGGWAGVTCTGKCGNAGKSPRQKLHNMVTCAARCFVTLKWSPRWSPTRSAPPLVAASLTPATYRRYENTKRDSLKILTYLPITFHTSHHYQSHHIHHHLTHHLSFSLHSHTLHPSQTRVCLQFFCRLGLPNVRATTQG